MAASGTSGPGLLGILTWMVHVAGFRARRAKDGGEGKNTSTSTVTMHAKDGGEGKNTSTRTVTVCML